MNWSYWTHQILKLLFALNVDEFVLASESRIRDGQPTDYAYYYIVDAIVKFGHKEKTGNPNFTDCHGINKELRIGSWPRVCDECKSQCSINNGVFISKPKLIFVLQRTITSTGHYSQIWVGQDQETICYEVQAEQVWCFSIHFIIINC